MIASINHISLKKQSLTFHFVFLFSQNIEHKAKILIWNLREMKPPIIQEIKNRERGGGALVECAFEVKQPIHY